MGIDKASMIADVVSVLNDLDANSLEHVCSGIAGLKGFKVDLNGGLDRNNKAQSLIKSMGLWWKINSPDPAYACYIIMNRAYNRFA